MNKKKGKGHDYSYIQWSRKFIIDRNESMHESGTYRRLQNGHDPTVMDCQGEIGRWKKGEPGASDSRTKIQKAEVTKVSGLYRILPSACGKGNLAPGLLHSREGGERNASQLYNR